MVWHSVNLCNNDFSPSHSQKATDSISIFLLKRKLRKLYEAMHYTFFFLFFLWSQHKSCFLLITTFFHVFNIKACCFLLGQGKQKLAAILQHHQWTNWFYFDQGFTQAKIALHLWVTGNIHISVVHLRSCPVYSFIVEYNILTLNIWSV